MLGPPLCSCSPTLYREGTMTCLVVELVKLEVVGVGSLLLICRVLRAAKHRLRLELDVYHWLD
jgi:hypothetical protein